MEFDWVNTSLDRQMPISFREIEESFEDPLSIKILPDSPRFAEEARFFNLGKSLRGAPIFSVYRSNGKQLRIVSAREAAPEEAYFYERKQSEWT
jgi:uncharacterized DUF497 family protein